MGFKYIPSHEVDARHRAAAQARSTSPRGRDAARPATAAPTPTVLPQRVPRTRNIETVLSLGHTRYFLFQGRTYGCPPIPFQLGLRMNELYVHASTLTRALSLTGRPEDVDEYRKTLRTITKVLWSHIVPARPWRKWFKRFRLMRNPFRRGSEKEIMDVVDFFLEGRMKSSVQPAKTVNDL